MIQFVIPFRCTTKDRIYNLQIVIDHIKSNFDYPVLVSEYDYSSKVDIAVDVLLIQPDGQYYNKAKCINYACKHVECNYVCVCDSDILFNIDSFKKSLKLLLNNKYDFIFPFTGPVYNISRYDYKSNSKIENLPKSLYSNVSVGGIIMFNKNSFFSLNGYNDNLYGWGGEDFDFYLRIQNSKYTIYFTEGELYHLKHIKSKESFDNEVISNIHKELQKIK